MTELNFFATVIGSGPAGLAAAAKVKKEGKSVVLIEREAKAGGILKQCIHDGFGLIRFKEKLTGPEYAQKEIDEVTSLGVEILTLTFVTKIERKEDDCFDVHFVSRKGYGVIHTQRLILATGCRERTSKQVFIHGDNPAGVMTAGCAQHYINLLGAMPTKRCVILGSGDIGLIMARRLTLEGAKVIGVYEVKPTPSGLTRNVVQCLYDYDIPLYLSHTVTKVFGKEALEGVEISRVDEKMNPIEGTQTRVECDGLILSVGLIPETELLKKLDIALSSDTKGALVDQNFMTLCQNVFSCGNAVHVNDLADYVSESGEKAGEAACGERHIRRLIEVKKGDGLLYAVPQLIDTASNGDKIIMYFRVKEECENKRFTVYCDGQEVFSKHYSKLRPPEMERVVLKRNCVEKCQQVRVCIEEETK